MSDDDQQAAWRFQGRSADLDEELFTVLAQRRQVDLVPVADPLRPMDDEWVLEIGVHHPDVRLAVLKFADHGR